MSDQFPELIEGILDAGYKEQEFWAMSLDEVRNVLESFYRTSKFEIRKQFSQAKYLAELVGTYLNKENVSREIWDFWPKMFAEEKKEYEEMMRREEIERAKENRRAYAQAFNKKRHGG